MDFVTVMFSVLCVVVVVCNCETRSFAHARRQVDISETENQQRSMPILKADPILSTSYDDRCPPEGAFDSNSKKFFATTGMFPQEVLVAFPDYPNGVNLARVLLISTGIKKLKIMRCAEHVAANFEALVECDISAPAREGELQREQFAVSKGAAGSGIRFVKFVIEGAYAPFVTLRSVVFEGEPNTA